VLPWLAGGVREPDRIGLASVALAPALLAGPSLAARLGGRMDRVGALLLGTIGLSFLLLLMRASPAAQTPMLAFIVGAGIVSAVPTLPAVIRTAIQRIGDLAFIALLAVAVARFDYVGSALFATAALFAVTIIAALLVARIGGIDPGSAVIGAGSRDPAVATALAVAAGGSTAVPLIWTVLLALALGSVALANRRKPR
jgi:hypothetical protein